MGAQYRFSFFSSSKGLLKQAVQITTRTTSSKRERKRDRESKQASKRRKDKVWENIFFSPCAPCFIFAGNEWNERPSDAIKMNLVFIFFPPLSIYISSRKILKCIVYVEQLNVAAFFFHIMWYSRIGKNFTHNNYHSGVYHLRMNEKNYFPFNPWNFHAEICIWWQKPWKKLPAKCL